MKRSLSNYVLSAALLLAGACGSPTSSGRKVSISTKPLVSDAAHSNSAADICATFTLTPYSFNGQTPVQAGAPVSFTTTSSSTYTDEILGCNVETPSYIPPVGTVGYVASPGTPVAYNWAFLVSATAFTNCSTHAVIDPATINPSPAYFAPVNCLVSHDAALSIDYPISVEITAPTGDIDISAGVHGTNQFVGCKAAEIPASGQPGAGELHFGESYAFDSTAASSPAPYGLVGFTTASLSSDSALAQYGGQGWAADADGDAAGTLVYNTYYNGQFTTAAAAFPSALFQTYLADYSEAQIYNGTSCAEWVDSRHAFCLTTGTDLNSSTGVSGAITSANAPVTSGHLADAFLYILGTGYAAASVTDSGSTITIYSQLAANSASDYSAPSLAPVSDNGAFASTATTPPLPAGAGFNDGLATVKLSPSGTLAGATFTGVYIDPSSSGQFLVGASLSGHNYTATLAYSSGWALTNISDIATGVIPTGFGVSASGCITPRHITSIAILPTPPAGNGGPHFVLGGGNPYTQQLTITATYSDGTSGAIAGNLVTWTSAGNPVSISVDTNGLVTDLSGQTTPNSVTATLIANTSLTAQVFFVTFN